MKLFRYRRASVNTLLGITKAKKQFNRAIGLTAIRKPFRALDNAERRWKRRLGYYSPLGKFLRLGAPTLLGIRLPAAPKAKTPTQSARTSGSLFATLVILAIITGTWALIIGGCDSKRNPAPHAPITLATIPQKQTPTIEGPITSAAPSNGQAQEVSAFRPTTVEPSLEIADHDLTEPVTAPTPRDWTDRSGKFHTAAVLLGVADGIAQLQRQDKTLHVPVARLSDADYAYLASTGIKTEPRTITGRVVGVHDGDTLIVLDEHNEQHKIRLASIDAPERHQAFGSRSREALVNKVFQKEVKITWREHDKYGRTIGDLYLDDRWINKELVQEGFAWHYRKYSESKELGYAEATAHSAGLGLWTQAEAMPPWEYRHREKEQPNKEPQKKDVVSTPPRSQRQSLVDSTPASSPPSSSSGEVHVRGYYRKDGTYVRPHTRSRPSR